MGKTQTKARSAQKRTRSAKGASSEGEKIARKLGLTGNGRKSRATTTERTFNGKPFSGPEFSVRIRSDSIRKKLQAVAKKHGLSMTQFMRDAVYDAIKKG